MSKFNKKATEQAQPPAARAPLATAAVPTLTTHEGGPAYAKDVKSELFQLAVTNMVGENTFYERAADRDNRFAALVRDVAVADPAWTLGFVGWLRGEANMRSASLVAAAEAVKARLDAQAHTNTRVRVGAVTRKPSEVRETPAVETPDTTNRQIVASVLQRADEPGEFLAYWMSTHGRKLPQPVKRGVADAARRLYTEYSLLKYDTASHGVRFADVLDLAHPAPATPAQGALFRHALDRRHGRDTDVDTMLQLPMVVANQALRRSLDTHEDGHKLLTNPAVLASAGMTWEDVLSLAGNKIDKRKLWEALAPNLPYMAALRNLRNMDEAGVSNTVAAALAARLTDPAAVAKSRQLPFRFYTAYLAAPSDRWKHPLGQALDQALSNVPELPGRTLVLIDTSGSMTGGTISARSTVTPAQAAAVLGIVLAKRCGADVYGWADRPYPYQLTKGRSALAEIDGFLKTQGRGGHGTNLTAALGAFKGHDRVFVLSDMQTIGARIHWSFGHHDGTTYDRVVPAHVPVYAFDLQGYRATPFTTAKPNRYQLGGYTDRVFSMVPLLERGEDAAWPWEG